MKNFKVLGILFILLCSSLHVSASTTTPVKGEIEKVGASFVRSVAMSGAAAIANGTAYQYVILQGDPAVLAVYKLPSKELIDKVKLPKSTAAWAITTDASGNAWIGGTPTATLYSYNPVAKKLTNHGTPDSSHTSILDLDVVGNAIYGSTAPNGKVFKFEKGKFKTLGTATSLYRFHPKTKSTEDLKVNLAGTEAVSLDFVKLSTGEIMLTGLLGITGTHLLYNVATNS